MFYDPHTHTKTHILHIVAFYPPPPPSPPSNTHTHTHTLLMSCNSTKIHYKLLLTRWWKREEWNDKSVCRSKGSFQFWLKRWEWKGVPDTEWKRVPDDRTSLPWSSCLSLEHGQSLYLRLNKDNEKNSRDETNQWAMEELYQRQCRSRWEIFCNESGCRLVGSHWRSMSKGQISELCR